MDLKKRTLDARAPAEGRAAPLPLPQEGEGRAAPLPTPRPFDGETITLPLPAPGGSEREATGERKPRGIVISKRALDYFMDRYEGHFVRFNNMGAALRRAARDVKERVHQAGDVFDLKPQTPLEDYILSRLKSAAPAEDPDVAARRRDWDEAKRTGDPDAMTRTANALLRASEGAGGGADEQTTTQVLSPRGERSAELGWRREYLPSDERDRDDGGLGKQLTGLALEQAKTVAAAIAYAPVERRAGMLQQIKDRLGELITAQVHAQMSEVQREVNHSASGDRGKATEIDDANWWETAWEEFWRWVDRSLGGRNRGGQSPLPDEDYEVEQESDEPVGSRLTESPMTVQRDELGSPLDPSWSPSRSRYDPPRKWRQIRKPVPTNRTKLLPHETTPFAQTERGKVLVGIDELDPIRKAQFKPALGTWMWPTSYPPTQKQLAQGLGYFGAPRGGKGAFHGGLDFHADPDPNKETEVRMPTGARLISAKESGYFKTDKTGKPILDARGQPVWVSIGCTLRFDLGNGVILELLHVKPTEEILLLQAEIASGGGRSSRFIPRGMVIGFVDRDAYEGRNDHVHLQVTMQGGRMNGQGVSGFAIDPTELFDWDQPERNREGGDLLP